ncbi:esterase/lipase family protein [Nocardioides currus]|uniref:Alpha/beta hydrolase n=1 Tax=Nocardioides currus TaxID=2133958 RepID=A0A2R7YX96_9ACTN|nr:alpha/beta fold hydrolase [Nocardioides currus]PUA80934.1 alpha/beta hydrolase [Nocardioides currus]
MTTRTEPTLLDALSLLAQVVDEVVVDTARDTHLAWVDRVHGLLDGPLGPTAVVAGRGHRTIARSVYAGIGLSVRGAGVGLAAGSDLGPALGSGPRSRFLTSAANGLVGDRLERERPRLATRMAARVVGRDVPLTSEGLAAAYPTATGRVVVLVHGLCEDEVSWQRGRARRGTTYAEELAERGWTPVLLRLNTGLPVRANGAALAALLERLVALWPTEVDEVALVGHSMGGLVIRAASAVQGEWTWRDRVGVVVTLGTPHLGAPLARAVRHGSGLLARVPEVAGFGRVLDQRSAGVDDLIEGLDEDVAALPHARYALVSATVTTSARHPAGAFLGDLLVRRDSALGRDRRGRDLFPGAEVLHLRGHHFDLLNDARVGAALTRWLA